MSAITDEIKSSRIIAAVRDDDGIKRACASDVRIVFMLGGTLIGLRERVDGIKKHGKRVFVHIDLCEGLGKDAAAVDFCSKVIRLDGIISTRAPLIRRAAENGLATVQRMFLMDSQSLINSVRLIKASECDMIEVLPGIAPKAISFMRCELDKPVIAGGMITLPGEVEQALNAGAAAVSTSCTELWNKDFVLRQC